MSATRAEAVLRGITDGTVERVLAFAPAGFGQPLGRVYPAESFRRKFVDGPGAGICGAYFAFDPGGQVIRSLDVAGRFRAGSPDVWSVADLDTLRPFPWIPNAASCVLDVQPERGAGETSSWAPRSVLTAQVDELRRRGARLQVATELEFVVARDTPSEAGHFESPVRSVGSNRLVPVLELWPFLDEFTAMADAAGLAVEAISAEAAPGQFEINLRHGDPVDMADRHTLFKLGLQETARRHGLTASFMARPSTSFGNSCHVHASLELADERDVTSAALTFDSFVAGQLELGLELLPMFTPNPNSFRRFEPSIAAPTVLAAGPENRSAAVRIVGSGADRRTENRIPGADANPYFALAAMAAQARFGIDHQLDPPETWTTPVGPGSGHPELPADPKDALEAFENSARTRELIGADACCHVVGLARHEIDQWVACPDDERFAWEVRRYFSTA